MDNETSVWKTGPFWLLMAILALVAALLFMGVRYRDVTVGMEIVPKVMARKAAVLSAIRVHMIQSVGAEKSAVMADTDGASAAFAEEWARWFPGDQPVGQTTLMPSLQRRAGFRVSLGVIAEA